MKKKRISEEEEIAAMKFMLMTSLHELGVTPEEYAKFIATVGELHGVYNAMNKLGESNMLQMLAPEMPGLKPWAETQVAEPIEDANHKSLRLKIKLQGVTKPPMWREVIVPADFNFSQLHYVIQAVTGLDDEHLWQFQHRAYDHGIEIGIPRDRTVSGFGLDCCTHDADETPVTAFLGKKGDKMVYVYDFSHEWIFDVTVEEVTDRHGEVAECTKWKSDVGAFDSWGGMYHYEGLRAFYADYEKMSRAQRRKYADQYGFDDEAYLHGLLDDSIFDIEFVNEELADIPDHWEDRY